MDDLHWVEEGTTFQRHRIPATLAGRPIAEFTRAELVAAILYPTVHVFNDDDRRLVGRALGLDESELPA